MGKINPFCICPGSGGTAAGPDLGLGGCGVSEQSWAGFCGREGGMAAGAEGWHLAGLVAVGRLVSALCRAHVAFPE